MRLLILTLYSYDGASSRYRFYQNLPLLESYDIETTVQFLFSDSYVKKIGQHKSPQYLKIISSYLKRITFLISNSSFDLVFIEKELMPWMPYVFESLLMNFDAPYVVDYDDASFHRYDSHSKSLVRRLLGNKIDQIMKKSSLVIAGNTYLAARATDAGAKRVEVLPTVIDINKYNVMSLVENTAITIGWIGSPSTTKYLQGLASVFQEIAAENNNTRLVAIGANDFQIDGVEVEVKRWSEESEVSELQKIDIGVMPLDDTPWSRGKCGFKLIQYMACSKPVIASPIGVNSEIVEHGVNGFLASTLAEWKHYLQALINNRELSMQMGKQGRLKVEREFSLQVTGPQLVEFLKSVK
jgi:glycosyltransferase involved in cell wall biosynthesis